MNAPGVTLEKQAGVVKDCIIVCFHRTTLIRLCSVVLMLEQFQLGSVIRYKKSINVFDMLKSEFKL